MSLPHPHHHFHPDLKTNNYLDWTHSRSHRKELRLPMSHPGTVYRSVMTTWMVCPICSLLVLYWWTTTAFNLASIPLFTYDLDESPRCCSWEPEDTGPNSVSLILLSFQMLCWQTTTVYVLASFLTLGGLLMYSCWTPTGPVAQCKVLLHILQYTFRCLLGYLATNSSEWLVPKFCIFLGVQPWCYHDVLK